MEQAACVWMLLAMVATSCSLRAAYAIEVPVPRFTINLDQPASERFREVDEHFRFLAPGLVKELDSLVPKDLRPLLIDAAEDFMTRLSPDYDAEMRGVAGVWNISLGYVVAANLLYDFSAACTSIVVQAENGTLYHGRNLDYSFGGLLRDLTYIGDFQSGGKTVYVLTTYAGYFGALSGMRSNSFTVTVDERDQGAIWENVAMALLDKKSRPMGFLVRDTLAQDGMDFVGAVEKLSTTPLIAPVYLILSGVQPGQGAVITRNQLGAVDTWYLDASVGRWYVLETNYDHWKPPPSSDDRRHPAEKVLDTAGRGEAGYALLQKVLNTPPVLNSHTTYTILMSAAHPEQYKSWVQRI